MMDSSAFIQQQ
jgi:hypothetical protein